MDLVEDVPKPTQEQWLAGLLEAQTYLHSLGITMLQDVNVNLSMVEAFYEAAKRLSSNDHLVLSHSVELGLQEHHVKVH